MALKQAEGAEKPVGTGSHEVTTPETVSTA
jgi:hypothetical protein